MSIIKINSKTICPEGHHDAVLNAVYSIGLQPGYIDESPKTKHVYVFELVEKIPDGPLAGQPYVVSAIYTDSLNEKSRLYAAVKALKGGLTAQELQANSFDPASMIGLSCTIVTVNQVRADKVMPSIESIYKRDSSLPPLTPTIDMTKVPDWVQRMQNQRLDKPNSVNNAA